jgi:hypothetical protein
MRDRRIEEIAVERHLVASVTARGGLCLKFISPGRRGAPDRIVCLPGRPAHFVEVKRPRNGKLASHQVRYHNDLKAAGQPVSVLWSREEVDAFLARI